MNRLLVPVDFSVNAADALRYAYGVAQHVGYGIDCLNVAKIHTRSHFMSPTELNNLEAESRKEAQSQLEAFIAATLADTAPSGGVDVRPVVRIGFAIEEIIGQAHGGEYIALVMGTKGMSNLGEKILGSNTANVLENVKLPVISVPQGAVFTPVDELTYICNLEQVCLPCIGHLFAFSQRISSRMCLLHIDEVGAYRRPGAKEQLERLVRLAISNENVAVAVLEAESQVQGVVEYLKEHPTDLIALSLQDITGFRKLFRKAIEESLRSKLHIPILTLKS